MAALKLVCALVACMLVVAPIAQAAVTCGTVASSVAPCIGYLRGSGPLPPACCSGIKSLNAAAVTTADRQTACRCLQNASKSISGINPGLAAGLPGKCGVSIPYKISTSTDCSKVKCMRHVVEQCVQWYIVWVELVNDCHTIDQMKVVEEEYKELLVEECLVDEVICQQELGKIFGYVKGLGYGQKPTLVHSKDIIVETRRLENIATTKAAEIEE
ncbi:hypothetical protein Dsin_007351 [Dipteronia sinensis]|uniref:Non-specific lipid-transfer protein n=1 Tax=Dipteronia sinensis TaxID=43782 RepID=A0AAE0B1D5_9ROSI|nr:hypothetical protein Dsin_007351 [Dipteronia sinensis]